jgi:AraC family transcriptional regulator, regulatory protein of adaptative response / methylated-DNA-[protein]-cysteine methyltransferase
MQRMPSLTTMTRVVDERSPGYDGIFFVAVRTTGIFCRPSCPSRKALPRNRQFFRTIKEALFAGYRPCKRCRPLDVNGKPPDWVERVLVELESDPSVRWRDADLRKRAIDPVRARRYFVQNYGMTFQAYCRGRRMGAALARIRDGATVDTAAQESGYESNSGFRGAFAKAFGLPPGKGRQQDCLKVAWAETPLGPLVMAANDDGLCMLEFTDRRMLPTQCQVLQRRLNCAVVPGMNEILEQTRTELDAYFAKTLRQFTVPLVFPGSEFQVAVWNALLTIPYGTTWSYEQLAIHVGTPRGSRAVGHANGQNRIGIIIPCHRVVNKDGKLGGYGGGLWRKQFLLDLERGFLPEDNGVVKRK